MKINRMIVPAFASCGLTTVCAQGLRDIGARFDDEVKLPFSLILASSAGWDSNPQAGSFEGPQAGGPGDVSLEGSGSAFWENTMALHMPAGNKRDRFYLEGNLATTMYADPPPGTEEFQLTGGLSASYVRVANSRLSYGDTIHLSRQTEPDLATGTPVNRPTGGYFSGSNRLWVSYGWSTRCTAITSWVVDVFEYDEIAQRAENSIRHLFSEELRYALTTRTTATLSYRFGLNRYPDSPGEDSTSHFLLLGADRPLGRFFSMSLKGGVEFRSYEGELGSTSEPYVESAIQYHARVNTTFRWYLRSGLEDSGSPGTQSRSSLRTGLSASQVLAPGLTLNAGVNLVDYSGSSDSSTFGGGQEDTLEGLIGLNYSRRLWRKFTFNADYTYSTMSSDDPLSDYQRHRVSVGMGASF